MNDASLEDKLIIVDIVPAMVDYASVQQDLNETKAQSAQLVAQKLDIERLIGAANVARCYENSLQAGADTNLRNLIIPALCYFTYARMLKMFHGTLTDSGFTIEVDAEDRGNARAQAGEMIGIAETFMEDVFDFLEAEDPDDENVDATKVTPRIRRFGGNESRASN